MSNKLTVVALTKLEKRRSLRTDDLETVPSGDGKQLFHVRRLIAAPRDLRHLFQGFLESSRRADDQRLRGFCAGIGKLMDDARGGRR